MTLPLITIPAGQGMYRQGRLRSIRLGVFHGTVSAPGPGGARNIGGFFARTDRAPSSAHVTVDGGGTGCRSVQDGDTAYAAPNANADGLHLEMCMQPTRDATAGAAFWASALGRNTLNDAAQQMGTWCLVHHIPVRWLTAADVRAGHAGLCDHETISEAYNPGGHWDVGAGFPIPTVLALVAKAVGGGAPFTPPKPPPSPVPSPHAPPFPGVLTIGSRGPGVTTMQKQLQARGWRITVDGNYGPGTAGIVAAFQQEKRLKADGICGQYTWAALWALAVTA